MKVETNSNAKHWAIKVSIVVIISLMLLIPLAMIDNVISNREMAKIQVIDNVSKSFAGKQIVGGPILYYTVVMEQSDGSASLQTKTICPSELDYKVNVTTDILHRSIYDVIVYNSTIEITGKLPVRKDALSAVRQSIKIHIDDVKGITSISPIKLGEKSYNLERGGVASVQTDIELPHSIKDDSEIDFAITVHLKGTESLKFRMEGDETAVCINSSYPHPSFQGDYLPQTRDVSDDGFYATWRLLKINRDNDNCAVGVKFINPADSYQQSARSVDYGLLIITLVFVVGLLVELITRKEINVIQYAVIGLSLVLFYSLLFSFSEFIVFGFAYLIAATMTTVALMLYFRAILKNRSAYLLGGFVAFVYIVNYILLQMEVYAMLAGSLVLFVMLSVFMYFTANLNSEKTELIKSKE